jgi:pyridoxamine 5'-phosphate oxidase
MSQAPPNSHLAPWRAPLARALHRNRALPHSRYVQLATVTPQERPSNRTIVFRGFWQPTNQLKFITDQRSAKAEHLTHQPWVEVCWYFPKTREQFRVAGRMQLIDATCKDAELLAARDRQWMDLSEQGRSQFFWPHPGQPIPAEPIITPEDSGTNAIPKPFCLLLLNPETVDHLELRGDPQQRWRYEWSATASPQWQLQAINP